MRLPFEVLSLATCRLQETRKISHFEVMQRRVKSAVAAGLASELVGGVAATTGSCDHSKDCDSVSKILQKTTGDLKIIIFKLDPDFDFGTLDIIDQINIKSALITLQELHVEITQRVDPDNTILSLNCSRTSSAIDRNHLVSIFEQLFPALLEFASSIVLSPEVRACPTPATCTSRPTDYCVSQEYLCDEITIAIASIVVLWGSSDDPKLILQGCIALSLAAAALTGLFPDAMCFVLAGVGAHARSALARHADQTSDTASADV